MDLLAENDAPGAVIENAPVVVTYDVFIKVVVARHRTVTVP
jgi:hypothetical protein